MDAEREFDQVAKFDRVAFLFGENLDGDGFGRWRERCEKALSKAAEARGRRPIVETDPDMHAFVAGIFEDRIEAE